MSYKVAQCFGRAIQLPAKSEYSLLAILMAFDQHKTLSVIENSILNYYLDDIKPSKDKMTLSFPNETHPELLISVDIVNKIVVVEKGGNFPLDSWERELEINIVGHVESIFNSFRVLH